jgi:hypothetical protein
VLQTDYNESLAATIELSLSFPIFRILGPNARGLLGVVAFFPQGIGEKNLDWLSHLQSKEHIRKILRSLDTLAECLVIPHEYEIANAMSLLQWLDDDKDIQFSRGDDG